MNSKNFRSISTKNLATFNGGLIQTEAEKKLKSNSRYTFLYELLKAHKSHSWTSATVGAVCRSMIGSGVKIVPYEGKTPRLKDTKRAKEFFNQTNRQWDNIKDSVSLYAKLYQIIGLFRLLGQVGVEIVRDGSRNPIGFDVVSGFVIPNIDEKGYYKSPAYYVRPWGQTNYIEYAEDELAYFYNPGLSGSVFGETVYESLVQTTIPSDMYAAVSYRELFQNVNAPYNGVWKIDPATSDEDFDYFLELLEHRYTGAANFGKNPLVVRGGAEFVPTPSRNKEDAPYLDGRRYNQSEMSAVTGVDSNKLGLTNDANKANIRETRREFHENALRPMYVLLEDMFYNLLFRKVLGIDTLKLEFGRPDFATALEQATIDARYLANGVMSPNEVRLRMGYDKRESGDVYYEPQNMDRVGSDGEVREEPVNTGDPNTDQQRPERSPRDEEDISKALSELAAWRKFAIRVSKGERSSREFTAVYLPSEYALTIKSMIEESAGDSQTIRAIFDAAKDMLVEEYRSVD